MKHYHEHEPESVLESDDYKILCYFIIKTDDVIEGWRLDSAVVDKKRRTCKTIDFAVPRDSRIEEMEKEKIKKCQDLKKELQKNWNVRVKVIPLVVVGLGAITKQFGIRLKEIGEIRILRMVLEI